MTSTILRDKDNANRNNRQKNYNLAVSRQPTQTALGLAGAFINKQREQAAKPRHAGNNPDKGPNFMHDAMKHHDDRQTEKSHSRNGGRPIKSGLKRQEKKLAEQKKSQSENTNEILLEFISNTKKFRVGLCYSSEKRL